MKTTNVAVFAFLGDCYLESGLTARRQAAWEEGLAALPGCRSRSERERLDRLVP